MTLGKLLSFFMLLFPLLLFVLIVGLVRMVSVAEHNGKLVGDRSSKYYLNTNDKEDLFLFFFFQNIVKQPSIFSLLLFYLLVLFSLGFSICFASESICFV